MLRSLMYHGMIMYEMSTCIWWFAKVSAKVRERRMRLAGHCVRHPVLREILHLRNLWLLGYLRMRQVFRRQVFRKG